MHVPRIKKPHIEWGLLELVLSSVRNLLEKVGDSEVLQFWSNQNWHFWHSQIYTYKSQTISDYHPSIWMGFLNYYVLLYYDFLDTLFCNLFEIFKLVLVYMHPKNKENTNLCLQGQTVSDYQPLFSNLCIYLLKDFFFGCMWT